ncbi:MAG: hypothetical protein COA67_09010 [Lutibacter sp.]|nr:MAG: hypothetical protein COA67_09010 [Lutibacter sp.]
MYLAQLLKEGYIDYIVTVNFDDLILRACALFNFLPPVYDISNVKLPTTSNYREESVIYLHGQHYGQWLLNDRDELEKVKEDVAKVFGEITTKRSWIVVGYSGQDEIFNQLVNLGSFSKGLFWVNYLNTIPADNVSSDLLDVSNTNAHLINGYDSDSFFLKLHSEIEDLKTPEVFNKPFSFLKDIVNNVKDIEALTDDTTHKDLFNEVKERMDITNRLIDRAISEIENDDSVDKFKQEIIDAYLKSRFEENEEVFLEKIQQKDFEGAKEELSIFYHAWGNEIYYDAKSTSNENLYKESFEKYKEAIMLSLKNSGVFNDYGNAISDLAKSTSNENLFKESFEKYENAIKLNPNNDLVYYNYGTSIAGLARLSPNVDLYKESIEKFEEVIKLNPKFDSVYDNYGNVIFELAELTSDKDLYKESFEKYEEALKLTPKSEIAYCNYATALTSLARLTSDVGLYKESFEKFKKTIILNPKYEMAYCNYGNSLSDLAELTSDIELFKESFEKYEEALKLKPKDKNIYYNYGTAILDLAKLTLDKEMFKKSMLFLEKGYKLGGEGYNLACAYAMMKDKENALKYLQESLEEEQITTAKVLADDDWKEYLEDKDFIKIIESH